MKRYPGIFSLGDVNMPYNIAYNVIPADVMVTFMQISCCHINQFFLYLGTFFQPIL